ncbi:hypothetical protein [Aneurinibacillus migulanus]|uniref:hypothetical protein n=1 Tax=Aneurinibacillus migulanus TaxID=47500 RepID=UPI001F192E3D|nr:hypothetical protein [Aneurinibacillus migulanus]
MEQWYSLGLLYGFTEDGVKTKECISVTQHTSGSDNERCMSGQKAVENSNEIAVDEST